MGYRSHGAFALRREAYDNARLLDIKLPEILKQMCPPVIREDWVYWEYGGFKMYDGYADVDELLSFFRSFTDYDEDWPDELLWAQGAKYTPYNSKEEVLYAPKDCVEYIRIGEEYGDIEHAGAQGPLKCFILQPL